MTDSTTSRLSSRESLFRLGRLIRKELIEIIRDRRTMITLVLMPLLLYPLLSVAFQQFFLASSIDPNRGLLYRLGFATAREAEVFDKFLIYGEQITRGSQSAKESGERKASPKWTVLLPPDLEKALRDGEVDLAIHLKDAERFHLPLTRDLILDGDIQFVSGNPAALGALTFVERHLAAVNEYHLETRLGVAGEYPKAALLHLTRTALAVAGGDSMISLAALVPL
ncbi:MAG TPA: hypothetical protein VNX28_05320, partial [Gemmataceae bacterium]|nr:hypothetical protein [Gemmataceae bacterium]